MKHITSLENPIIKSIAKLKTKKGRSAQQLFVAEGIRTCSAIVKAGMQPTYVLATENSMATHTSFLTTHPVIYVTQKIMEKISSCATPSGIMCIFPIPTAPDFKLLSEGIVLTHLQDPGNMGTAIRTCAAFNKKTIVLIDGVDPWSPKVVQSTAGAIASVTLFQISWAQLIEHKKNNKLIALVVKGGHPPQSLNFAHSLLVIGSEAHGIPQEYLDSCDELVTIPMPGNTESLNAATAGAIAMYAAWGQ